MDTLSHTGKSKFIQSVFNPQDGPQSKPDNVLVRHHPKSETTTVNVSTGASIGILVVLFPNSPTRRIGAVYTTGSTAGTLVLTFLQWLEVAQDLGENYDYSRLTARVVTVQSSTIASGAFTVSGSFNAIRLESTLSEITTVNYDKILGLTEDPLDKRGNVPINTGIVSLTLPETGESYTRLGDLSPTKITSSLTPKIPLGDFRIHDEDNALRYVFKGEAEKTVFATNGTDILSVDVAAEIVDTSKVDFEVRFSTDTTTGGTDAVSCKMTVTTLGLGGNTVKAYAIDHFQAIPKQRGSGIDLSFFESLSIPRSDITQPIVALRLSVRGISNTAVISMESVVTVTISSPLTRGVGRSSPVTLVAAKGVNANTIFNITGVSNYELIPNATLIKNQTPNYPSFDPVEENFYRALLANRQDLGISTVMTIPEWYEIRKKAKYIYDMHSQIPPRSSGFFHILNKIRQVATPVLSGLFPEFAPLIGAGSAALGQLLPKSASGYANGPRSAGREGVRHKAEMLLARQTRPLSSGRGAIRRRLIPETEHPPAVGKVVSKRPKRVRFGLPPPMDLQTTTLARMVGPTCKEIRIEVHGIPCAFFMSVFTPHSDPLGQNPQRIGGAVYMAAVLTKDLVSRLKQAGWPISKMDYYESEDKIKGRGGNWHKVRVYNASVPSGCSFPPITDNVVLLPVERYMDHTLWTSPSLLTVDGESHQLAACVACAISHGKIRPPPRVAYTGGVTFNPLDRRTTVEPVTYFEAKRDKAKRCGLQICGNNEAADIDAKSVVDAVVRMYDESPTQALDPTIVGGIDAIPNICTMIPRSSSAGDPEVDEIFSDFRRGGGMTDATERYLREVETRSPPPPETPPDSEEGGSDYGDGVPSKIKDVDVEAAAGNPPPTPVEEEDLVATAVALMAESQVKGLARVALFLYEYPRALENLDLFLRTAGENKTASALISLSPPTSAKKSRLATAESKERYRQELMRQGYTPPEEIGNRGYRPEELAKLERGPPRISDTQVARITSNLIRNPALSGMDTEEIQEWVKSNGGGPSDNQSMYLAQMGSLPEPLNHAKPPRKEPPAKAVEAFTNMLPTQEMKEEGREKYLAIWRQNGGRGPSEAQAKELRDEFAEMRGSLVRRQTRGQRRERAEAIVPTRKMNAERRGQATGLFARNQGSLM